VNKQTPRPPGRLVDIEAHRLHLHCAGDGAPTVVFDATLGASSLRWSRVQPAIARVTRACAYDRAGFGWSEGGLMPRTAGRIADELHQLLEIAAVPGPYILVGHSYGGLVMRVFAARHAAAVAGLGTDRTSNSRRVGHAESRAARVDPSRCSIVPMRRRRGALRREDEGILAPMWKLPPEARQPKRSRDAARDA